MRDRTHELKKLGKHAQRAPHCRCVAEWLWPEGYLLASHIDGATRSGSNRGGVATSTSSRGLKFVRQTVYVRGSAPAALDLHLVLAVFFPTDSTQCANILPLAALRPKLSIKGRETARFGGGG